MDGALKGGKKEDENDNDCGNEPEQQVLKLHILKMLSIQMKQSGNVSKENEQLRKTGSLFPF